MMVPLLPGETALPERSVLVDRYKALGDTEVQAEARATLLTGIDKNGNPVELPGPVI